MMKHFSPLFLLFIFYCYLSLLSSPLTSAQQHGLSTSFPMRQVSSLDGFWEFGFYPGDEMPLYSQLDFSNETTMAAPAAFDTIPPYVSQRGTGAYRTKVTIDTATTKAVRLHFRGCSIYCSVYINGNFIKDHCGGYSEFHVNYNVTSNTTTTTTNLKENVNALPQRTVLTIVVLANNYFNETRCSAQLYQKGFYIYGGLLRSVELHQIHSNIYLDRAEITPIDPVKGVISTNLFLSLGSASPSKKYFAAVVDFNTFSSSIASFSPRSQQETSDEKPPLLPPTLTANLKYQFTNDCVSANFPTTQVSFMYCTNEHRLSFPTSIVVDNYKGPWSHESPTLHTATFYLYASDSPISLPSVELLIDVVSVRFGVRTLSTTTSRVLVNGSPVKIRGFNRHEATIQHGSSVPLQQVLADATILKDLNANFYRGSHYQQDYRWLQICDEFGFYGWNENLGWSNTVDQLNDPDFITKQLIMLDELISAAFNHPSTIMYALFNEGPSSDPNAASGYIILMQRMKQRDPSRLITYATMYQPYDDPSIVNLADIISVNGYPGWYMDDCPTSDINSCHQVWAVYFLNLYNSVAMYNKPFLISETGAGGIPGFRDGLFQGIWSEEFQATHLETIAQAVEDEDRYAGVVFWQMFDMRLYYNPPDALSLPRGYNNKGILDEHRHQKLAYRFVQRIWAAAKKREALLRKDEF